MAKLNISEEITPANKALIVAKINEIIEILVFLQVLSKADKQRLVKMGVKMEGYVIEIDQAAIAFPTAIPDAFPYSEFHKDKVLYSGLTQIVNIVASLLQSLVDTRMMVGSELLKIANAYYKAFKSAGNNNIAMDDALERISAAFSRDTISLPVVHTMAANGSIVVNNVSTGTQLVNKGQAVISFKAAANLRSKVNEPAIVVDPMCSEAIPSGWTHIEITNLSATNNATISIRMK